MGTPITVVMPSRNAEPWVGDAVRSVLTQTFTDFEFLVVDDASEDKTVEVVRAFHDRRIRIVRAGRVGFVKALNAGFREACGDWVARMDADDVIHPERLAMQLKFLREHSCLFVSCHRILMTPNGRFLVPRRQSNTWWMTPADVTLHSRNQFTEGATVFNRRAALDVGLYDEQFDNEASLYYKLLARGRGAVLGDALYAHRLRQASHSKTDLLRLTQQKIAVRQRYDPSNAVRSGESARMEAPGSEELELCARLVQVCVAAGDFDGARGIAFGATKRWPVQVRSWQVLLAALTGRTSPRIWRKNAGVAGWTAASRPWQDRH